MLQAAGANLVPRLNSKQSRSVIHIIIDEKSEEGLELYESYSRYKNWTFYSKRMILESILMGEEILDKYRIDADSL